MVTKYLNVNAEPSAIKYAAQVIREGGLVAFPTETVYGLGANATDAEAVAKIYVAKQRALNDPLIVHCAPATSPGMLKGSEGPAVIDSLTRQHIIGKLSTRQRGQATALIQQFWPGPLTLILPRGTRIPTNATAGLDTVGVRMPDHPVALALIRDSGVPIAAPSANRFGHVSPTTARHVLDDLDGRIDAVLDGGPATIGVESTVLDLTVDPPVILRPGGLGRAEIEGVVGRLGEEEKRREGDEERREREGARMAPGMMSKHYAPRAALRVVRDTDELLQQRAQAVGEGLRVGLLILAAQAEACNGLDPQFILGEELADVARNLYAGLRALDSDGVDVILVSEVKRSGLGEAIADRLRRGAARD